MDNFIGYIVDGKKFTSKHQALQAANYDSSKVYFYFMEQVWDHVDWTKEPDLSWDQLMAIRCQQLRNKYQHLCLWFSGGWDSTAILQAFVKNNIPLDEIIIFDRTYMQDDEVDDAKRYANHVKNTVWPDLKITIAEISFKDTLVPYTIVKDDWLDLPGANYRFSKNHRSLIHEYNPHVLRSKDQSKGKSRCDIEGRDKPRVHIHDNNWYTFSLDTVCHLAIDSPVELFYFSADLPELHIKQTWMSIHWFESLKDFSTELVHRVQKGDLFYQEWNRAIGRCCVENQSALNGLQKFQVIESINNQECAKLEDYAEKELGYIWKMYQQGVQHLKTMTRDVDESETVKISTGKSYLIKPVAVDQ